MSQTRPSAEPSALLRLRQWSSSAAVGFAFGFALEKAKVYVPSVIMDQMRFKSLIMLEMFLTAAAGGMVIMHVLSTRKILDVPARPPLSLGLHLLGGYGRNILGGATLGVGMAFAGACPGTVLVQAAVGVRNSFLVLSGALAASFAWPYMNELFARALPDYGKKKPVETLPHTFGLSRSSVVLIVTAAITAFISVGAQATTWALQLQQAYTLPLSSNSTTSALTNSTILLDPSANLSDLNAFAWHPIIGGLGVATAQLLSLLLLAAPLGASTQYAIFAGSIIKGVDPEWRKRASVVNTVPTVTPDSDWSEAVSKLLNTLGVVVGAYASASLGGAFLTPSAFAAPPASWLLPDGVKSFLGGALLLLGSRLADGCTSGHGISGVAALSTASTVSVASMFAGAMGVASIIY